MTGPRHIANSTQPKPKAQKKSEQKLIDQRIEELLDNPMLYFTTLEVVTLLEGISILIIEKGIVDSDSYGLWIALGRECEKRRIPESCAGPATRKMFDCGVVKSREVAP